ncbi:MAG: hypothetical protein ACHQ49_15445 [Elusimicrobiota bacterium]
MNMKIASAALAALLLAGGARAEDAKPAPSPKDSIMTFFQHLKESLSQSAVSGQRKHNQVGSVAAVRGADQSSPLADPNEPVLLGDARAKKDKAAMAEDAEISAAVDSVLAGRIDEGMAALQAFQAAHPKSRSLPKVAQAIEQAKGLAALKSGEAAPAADAVKAEAPKAGAPAGK